MPSSASSAAPAFLQRPDAERWIGPFRLIRQLGRGGFAPVWLAEEIYEGRRLRDAAVKLFFLPEGLSPGSVDAARWRDAILDEARALCRVEHPNVVRFYALHRDDAWGVVGLAMEHVAGASLDVRLREVGLLSADAVAGAALGVAWALSAVHGAGLVHRDVKPGNIIERAAAPGAPGADRGLAARPVYKLIDFGIVVDDPSLWPEGAAAPPLVGTPGYIAPELLLGGAATPASDLYALGATIFRLCTGQLPVEALGGSQALLNHRHPPRLDALLPPGTPAVMPLANLTALLLDPYPGARPRHAEWVARELERVLALSTGEIMPQIRHAEHGLPGERTSALDLAAFDSQPPAAAPRGAAVPATLAASPAAKAAGLAGPATAPAAAATGPAAPAAFRALPTASSEAAQVASLPATGPARPAAFRALPTASREAAQVASLPAAAPATQAAFPAPPAAPLPPGIALPPETLSPPPAALSPPPAAVPVTLVAPVIPPAAAPITQVVSSTAPTELFAPREPCLHAPLVGRGDALAALARLAAEARDGGVRAALITGPLGIGRTRLLAAALERAGFGAHRVLRAACSPERKSPLRPLLRALEALPPEATGALGALEDAIERALSPNVLPGAPDAAAAMEAVEDALLWASTEAPLAVALDDLQWADAHTLALLRLLLERVGASPASCARRGAPARLLVLAAARDEPNPSPPLRALLAEARGRARPGARHIAVGPLGDGDAARLARATLPVAPALERAVVRGSGGVPFFIVHALVTWRETGALVVRDGVWDAAEPDLARRGVPGVADLVVARLASYLDPASDAGRLALRALAAVALHGGGLGLDVLAEVTGRDDEALEAALLPLVDAGILTASGGGQHGPEYNFVQEMVRLSVLNLVRPRPWLRRLHRALLDAIARGPTAAADAAFLAAGYERLGAAQEARRWLRRAMEAAVSAGLFVEAVELGDRAAALTDDPDERAAAEIDVVRALLLGRKLEEAQRRLTALEARAAVFPARGAAVALRRRLCRLEVARGLREEGYDDPGLLEDADAQPDLALRCEARMALAGVAAGERAIELAGEAVALAERAGPALAFGARVLRFELNYASDRRDLAVAAEDLTRALAIAEALGSSWHRLHIEADLAVLDAERGRLAEAIGRLERIAGQAEADGMRGQLRLVLTNLAAFLLRAGRAIEAAETAGRTAELAAEAGDPALRASALSLRADALRRVGDLAGALAAADEAEALQRAHRDRRQALTLLRRAQILAVAGRHADALADARAARSVAEARADRDLALGARLWELLHLARRGEVGVAALEQAVAEAAGSGVTLRPLTLGLMDEARAWVAGGAQA
ncbi:serine/threonine-protein kinase [Sorangium sp. So ce1078]|uniref:serine/threonine-protein kinase n=1 Tax=Sorangium sp. So ce1078 TaxID=3133329 RepID=UPI003F61CB33